MRFNLDPVLDPGADLTTDKELLNSQTIIRDALSRIAGP